MYVKIAAHSAYEMFSWYKYLIVSLVFSHLGFWSGNLFVIAPFPDLCLLVPFHVQTCGGPKKSPRTSFIVQIIFSFWSFEISEDILRNQKFIIG